MQGKHLNRSISILLIASFIVACAGTPRVEKLTIPEQNEKAVAVFTDKGFEAVKTEKGVSVYLPPTIYFDSSKSNINLEARTKIAEIAQELRQPYLSARTIEVSGHADSSGDKTLNMKISKERALAATAELVFSKISKLRLITTWHGETKLRVPDINQDGTINKINRNLNRRVEFNILNPEYIISK